MSCSKKYILFFLILQSFFILMNAPYISGKRVFAPSSFVSDTYLDDFRYEGTNKITPRDKRGPHDYLSQERIYLKFYRDSLKAGDLPFWSDNTFGGISHDDSTIYSYISILNIPWLIIDNDHIAKGFQNLLIMNLGAITVLFLGYCLNLRLSIILFSTIIITANPLSMEFLNHSHQQGINFSLIFLISSFLAYLKDGKFSYLCCFIVSIILSISINFLSLFLLGSISLFILATCVLFLNSKNLFVNIKRLIITFWVYISCLLIFSFFLGPILLENLGLRAIIISGNKIMAPWSNIALFLDSLNLFGYGYRIWLPMFWVGPLIIFVSFFKRGKKENYFSLPLIILMIFAILVSLVDPFYSLFKETVPGLNSSGNYNFRYLYFVNLLFFVIVIYYLDTFKNYIFQKIVYAILFFYFIVNSLYLLCFLFFINSIDFFDVALRVGKRMFDQNVGMSSVIGILISLFLILFYYSLQKNKNFFLYSSILGIMVCYYGLYYNMSPNMIVANDPVNNPIFKNIPIGSNVLTLEKCNSKDRRLYRSEANLAGYRTFDSPVDEGIPIEYDKFWSYWNDKSNFKDLTQILWICSDKISKNKNLLKRFEILIRLMGVQYLISREEINSDTLKKLNYNGSLFLYKFSNPVIHGAFVKNGKLENFKKEIIKLINGKNFSNQYFNNFFENMLYINFKKETNLKWKVYKPEDNNNMSGFLFMNHPTEKYRKKLEQFVNFSLEGKWVYGNEKFYLPFISNEIPFRLVEIKKGNFPNYIAYNLSHFKTYGIISIIGLIFLIISIFFHFRLKLYQHFNLKS